MGAAWPAFDDAVVADDDVGVIAPLDCRLVTAGGHRQHHVAACQRTEVVHQRREVVARLEQYEPARHAELRGAGGDQLGEFAIAQRRGLGQHRGPGRRRSCRRSTSSLIVEDDPVADHLDADLGVDGRRVKAVLAHDDRGDVACGVDGQQHVVSQELGADALFRCRRALFAVRDHRRNKLFGPQHQRRGSVAGGGLHRYATERAFGDAGRHGARQ